MGWKVSRNGIGSSCNVCAPKESGKRCLISTRCCYHEAHEKDFAVHHGSAHNGLSVRAATPSPSSSPPPSFAHPVVRERSVGRCLRGKRRKPAKNGSRQGAALIGIRVIGGQVQGRYTVVSRKPQRACKCFVSPGVGIL
jgi:hypothetical protein